MKASLRLLLLPLLAVLMAACNNDKPSGPTIPSDALWDIVTVDQLSSTTTSFTLRKDGDSPLVTLVASYAFDDKQGIKVGQRLMICYTNNGHSPYTTGSITLYGYRLMEQTQPLLLEGTSAEYNNWSSDPLDMKQLWRTGQYINIQASAFCTTQSMPKRFILVADETTLDEETVKLHVIYTAANPGGENRQEVYASFDINSVWSKSTCKAVEVIYFTPSGTKTETFKKQTFTPTPID